MWSESILRSTISALINDKKRYVIHCHITCSGVLITASVSQGFTAIIAIFIISMVSPISSLTRNLEQILRKIHIKWWIMWSLAKLWRTCAITSTCDSWRNGNTSAEALIAKLNFHGRNIFSENLIAIEMHKLEVKFNKSIYVGIFLYYRK